MNLTNADIQEILRLLDDTAYDELHLQTDKFSLRLKRSPDQGGWTRDTQTRTTPQVTQLQDPQAPTMTQPAAEAVQPANAPADGVLEIRSPMVGTFYRSPKPGAAPFVEVGSRVMEHTVIAIIEVMKLMNSIAAGVTGEVVEILARDAQFVEPGQLLMRVKPAE
jgi:acetyl-CoA carboxylase biotin carboxyl carrier protein